jgi:hypothetical protein
MSGQVFFGNDYWSVFIPKHRCPLFKLSHNQLSPSTAAPSSSIRTRAASSPRKRLQTFLVREVFQSGWTAKAVRWTIFLSSGCGEASSTRMFTWNGAGEKRNCHLLHVLQRDGTKSLTGRPRLWFTSIHYCRNRLRHDHKLRSTLPLINPCLLS